MSKFSTFFALIVCLNAYAYEIGDPIQINGVPAFVFYVDATGDHGLAMTMPLGTIDFFDKTLSKYGPQELTSETYDDALNLHVLRNAEQQSRPDKNVKKIKNKTLYGDLVNLLGDNGKDNQKAVEAFCSQNDISIKNYFNPFYWATLLGEGWFIPGDFELTKFAEMYYGGLGKKNHLGNTQYASHYKDITNDGIAQSIILQIVMNQGGVMSSSMHNPKNGFRILENMKNIIPGQHWMDLYDSAPGRLMIVAVHEF